MKKVLKFSSLLLCIVLLFSSCSILPTEDINNIISNVANSIASNKTVPLTEKYNGKDNYYYSSLDEEKKIEYTKIYNAYMKYETAIVNLTEAELEYMFNCVLYDNPEIFWVDSNYSYTSYPTGTLVEPVYRHTQEESEQISKAVKMEVDKVVASASGIQSDYGKEKYFHDYICKKTVYDLSTYDQFGDSAYSVFVDGKSICEGYSRAMKLLLDEAGIYNYIVIGNTKNEEGKMEGHMWNVVSIQNELYHVDVTWDDSDGEHGEIGYLYFNMTDDDIRKDHFDVAPYNNNCTSRTYNYFNVNGTFFNSFTGLNYMVDSCAKNVRKDDLILEMRFVNSSDYQTVKRKIQNDNSFFDFVSKVVVSSGINANKNEIQYIYQDEFNYLCIIFVKGWYDG